MGRWRQFADAYGQREEWVPDWYQRPGYWQEDTVKRDGKKARQVRWAADPTARQPDWPAEAPVPCQVCVGHLLRWPGAGPGYEYEVRHYRGPHAAPQVTDDPWERDSDLTPAMEILR